MERDPKHVCALCGKTSLQAGPLLVGLFGAVCRDCVAVASEYVHQDPEPEAEVSLTRHERRTPLPRPQEIVDELDRWVIGQNAAKRTLALALRQHARRLEDRDADGPRLSKSNVLLIGPSGTGKTLLAKTAADILDVPFVMADATALTEAGYVGEDVESILKRLLQVADDGRTVDARSHAERGIVFLDEVDKLARRQTASTNARDVGGEGVQQALLKMIEGTTVQVPVGHGKRHGDGETIPFDTRNVLFILSGAFAGLDEIVARRIRGRSIGLRRSEAEPDAPSPRVTPGDLVEYGFIPEFVGRVPVLAELEALDEAALVRILTEPEDALLRQYEKLFAMEGVELDVSPEACAEIARAALALGTGARGLRAAVDGLLADAYFESCGPYGITQVVVPAGALEEGRGALMWREFDFEMKRTA